MPDHDDPVLGHAALNGDVDRWIRIVLGRERVADDSWLESNRIPDGIRDEVIGRVLLMDPVDFRGILRWLLPRGDGPTGADHAALRFNAERMEELLLGDDLPEYFRRLVRSAITKNNPSPIPDLTWVIDLYVNNPKAALDVLTRFLETHFMVLNDFKIDGLFDALALIRLRIAEPGGTANQIGVLRGLSSDELENVVERLWRRMGFDASRTPATRDGGRDVIAVRDEPADVLTAYIECKQWSARVGVVVVRALLGTISDARVPKGIIVAPGGFSSGRGSARDFAQRNPRIELLDGDALVRLMTENFGESWHTYVDRLSIRREH